MNNIHTLRSENAALRRELDAVQAGLAALRSYLNSPKFRCGHELDNYVNVSDVLARLRDVDDAGSLARESGVAA